MSDARQALQGIFYIQGKVPGDGWLYMVRADVRDREDATKKVRELARREGRPASVRIEDWNYPKGTEDGFAFSCAVDGVQL